MADVLCNIVWERYRQKIGAPLDNQHVLHTGQTWIAL
jgi:hypothetical protein